MQSNHSNGTTVAPTPEQGKTPEHQQTEVDSPVAPKTVTDHAHGSKGTAAPDGDKTPRRSAL
jgi:hypothetical protein